MQSKILHLKILPVVFSYLDSWTLASLALVSVRTRQLVAGLLDTKGCVALQWEKSDREGHWEVAYRRWFFSSHFTPVTQWGVEDVGRVSDHLKSCPYNIRTRHTKPDIKTKSWQDLMVAVRERIKQKRDSEWFIE